MGTESIEDNCDSSVDTNDALMEMLGLSPEESISLDVCEHDESSEKTTRYLAQQENSPLISTESIGIKQCVEIDLPPKCSRQHLDPSMCLALMIDDVFTADQCQTLVQMASNGFRYITEATYESPDGYKTQVELQNPNPHKLSAIDTCHDPQNAKSTLGLNSEDPGTLLMDQLYSTISASITNQASFQSFVQRKGSVAMQGLNPRMRVLKYDAEDDDRFEAHFDATTYVPGKRSRRQSLVTILVYLNDGDGKDFEGGETIYLDFHNSSKLGSTAGSNPIRIVPKTGRVVLFEHDLYHAGAPLSRGTKYIMRTDILFDENDVCDQNMNNNEGRRCPTLVSDICDELNFSQNSMNILKEMELLDITCESLLAPGKAILEKMLVDGGIDTKFVNSLVQKALAIANA